MRATLSYGLTSALPLDPVTGNLQSGWVLIATAALAGNSYSVLMSPPGSQTVAPVGYTLLKDGRAVNWTWSQAISAASAKGITLDIVPTIWAGDTDAATESDNATVLAQYRSRHPQPVGP